MAPQGVCKLGGDAGLTVFVERALPGEVLRAQVTSAKKRERPPPGRAGYYFPWTSFFFFFFVIVALLGAPCALRPALLTDRPAPPLPTHPTPAEIPPLFLRRVCARPQGGSLVRARRRSCAALPPLRRGLRRLLPAGSAIWSAVGGQAASGAPTLLSSGAAGGQAVAGAPPPLPGARSNATRSTLARRSGTSGSFH